MHGWLLGCARCGALTCALFARERVLRITVTALGMACAQWRCGEKTGARPRAVGWHSSLTNVPQVSRPVGLCNLYLSSMIESENAATLQHNETVSSCSSSSSSRELCVCVCVLEFAGVAVCDVPPVISDKWQQSRLRAGDRSLLGFVVGIVTARSSGR